MNFRAGVTHEGRQHLLQVLTKRFGTKFKAMSIEDVCQEYIVPTTLTKKEAWVDWIAPTHPHFVSARAAYFVSHAWCNSFMQLLETLDPYPGPIWLDVLVLKQHRNKRRTRARFSDKFAGLVSEFGHTLLVLAPWDDPAPLHRCWCLWEIVESIRSKCKIEILLPSVQKEHFLHALRHNFQQIIAGISNVDSRNAESGLLADQEMIKQAIEGGIGFGKINNLVVSLLREWLVTVAMEEMDVETDLVMLNSVGLLLLQDDKLEDAESLYLQGLQFARENFGNKHEITLSLVNNFASVLVEQTKMVEAEKLMLEFHNAPGNKNSLESRQNLAYFYHKLGNWKKAEKLYRETMKTHRTKFKSCNLETAVFLNNFAQFLSEYGSFNEAKPIFLKVLLFNRQEKGHRHPDTLDILNNLSLLLQQHGDLAEAEPLSLEATQAAQEIWGDSSQRTLTFLNNRALLLQDQGNATEAASLFRQVLARKKATLGQQHLATFTVANNLAGLLYSDGSLREAEELFRDTLQGCRQTLGNEHLTTLSLMHNHAEALQALDQMASAEVLYKEAARGRVCSLGKQHPDAQISLLRLGQVLQAQEKLPVTLPKEPPELGVGATRHTTCRCEIM
eukprot:Lithocolla_globosa_v1_NODE_1200_length_2791_cov_6.632310.p1 type:complete len:617 gc:universal NODE_1200_length_2791_cov_6.632310:937-2787(+)